MNDELSVQEGEVAVKEKVGRLESSGHRGYKDHIEGDMPDKLTRCEAL